MQLIIHAPNVHQGGGAALLLPLLSSIDADIHCHAIIDQRLQIPGDIEDRIEVIRVEPSLRARVEAERMLSSLAGPEDIVLCFGNLPPLFRLAAASVFVLIQNRYLIEPVSLADFPSSIRLRILMERCWLRLRASSVSLFIVQTPSMHRSLEQRFSGRVALFPFIRKANLDYSRSVSVDKNGSGMKFDFLYVASGDPHKNHQNLILAWQLLAADGFHPSLCLTIEDGAGKDLLPWINGMKTKHGLKITNIRSASQAGIDDLYGRAEALIYPSRCESLGLPLIEARNAGLPVLASELDYVRDVLDPEQTFDPESPVSIARAVKRFLGEEERPLPLKTAEDFIQYLLKYR